MSHHISCLQGKFYEMFEMDSHIGAEVLGLIYMKVGGVQADLVCAAATATVTALQTAFWHHKMHCRRSDAARLLQDCWAACPTGCKHSFSAADCSLGLSRQGRRSP